MKLLRLAFVATLLLGSCTFEEDVQPNMSLQASDVEITTDLGTEDEEEIDNPSPSGN